MHKVQEIRIVVKKISFICVNSRATGKVEGALPFDCTLKNYINNKWITENKKISGHANSTASFHNPRLFFHKVPHD